jgi:hypothetical protein
LAETAVAGREINSTARTFFTFALLHPELGWRASLKWLITGVGLLPAQNHFA